MQRCRKQMDLPSDPLEVSKQVSLSRESFFPLFCPILDAPSVGKQLIDKPSRCWEQHSHEAPALVSAEDKASKGLAVMRDGAFVVLLRSLLVSLRTPKKSKR